MAYVRCCHNVVHTLMVADEFLLCYKFDIIPCHTLTVPGVLDTIWEKNKHPDPSFAYGSSTFGTEQCPAVLFPRWDMYGKVFTSCPDVDEDFGPTVMFPLGRVPGDKDGTDRRDEKRPPDEQFASVLYAVPYIHPLLTAVLSRTLRVGQKCWYMNDSVRCDGCVVLITKLLVRGKPGGYTVYVCTINDDGAPYLQKQKLPE